MTTAGKAFTRKVLRPAKGTMVGQRRTIAVGFHKVEFMRISRMAQENGVAFQEQVRQLCKVALSRGPQETAHD